MPKEVQQLMDKSLRLLSNDPLKWGLGFFVFENDKIIQPWVPKGLPTKGMSKTGRWNAMSKESEEVQ